MQDTAAINAYAFALHSRHVSDPTDAEYLPISQSRHISDPVSALYFPATHSKHVPSLWPEEPALHLQAVETELPNREFEFAGHAWHSFAPTVVENFPAKQMLHAASPDAILYLPASHCVQFSPSAPDDPALQVQSASSSLASGALKFDGHP